MPRALASTIASGFMDTAMSPASRVLPGVEHRTEREPSKHQVPKPEIEHQPRVPVTLAGGEEQREGGERARAADGIGAVEPEPPGVAVRHGAERQMIQHRGD